MKKCSKCQTNKDQSNFYGRNAWCKSCFNAYCHERWKARKLKAVELMGGSCSKCDYNRNLSALEFHHIDPKTKEFNWKQVCKKPWDQVIQELSKCIIVCKNCHAEIHNPNMSIADVEQLTTSANSMLEKSRYATERFLKPTGKCAYHSCDNNVFATKYCSHECASLSQRKVVRPSKKELQNQLESDSIVKIGKRYGVSDNSVRKWMKAYQIL
jgi:hypothetical protein